MNPEYKKSNPKIDLLSKTPCGLVYVFSTNHFRLCRDALAYFQNKYPDKKITHAYKDKTK